MEVDSFESDGKDHAVCELEAEAQREEYMAEYLVFRE